MPAHPLDVVWRNASPGSSTPDPAGMVTRVYAQGAATGPRASARKTAPPRQQPGSDFVEALGHGLALLECWHGTGVWLTNCEIAQRSGLTRSTVSRLTAVLVDLGYVFRDTSRGNRLRLTASTLSLGFGSALAASGVSTVKPQLEELARVLDVYAALGIRRGDKVQILENVASPIHPDAVVMDVGGLLPICRSASGLAAMSALPEREASPLIRRLSSHYGARWEGVQRFMERKKKEYSSNGYCTSVATLSRDVGAIAVPIMTPESNDIFVIACGMPAQDFYPERVERTIAPRLLKAAGALAAALC
jgi:DNA-binding IclR family transcriptional regulator